MERRDVEVEELVGREYAQALLRAETLVPGAGRELIEPMLADARLVIDSVTLQPDRVVVEGTAACQAVYRQGEASELRGIAAQAPLSQVIELPGAAEGMLSRAWGGVEHVEAKYENGHIVFLVTCGIHVQLLRLASREIVTGIEGQDGLQTDFKTLTSVKLAAEAEATANLRDTVALPDALDARAALMDWAAVAVESVEPDLGGARVKGRVMVETLISSGVQGRPAALVRYSLGFDQLIGLPDWLAKDVFVRAEIVGLRTRIEPVREGESEAGLACEADVRLKAIANVREEFTALADVYATRGASLDVERGPLSFCAAARQDRFTELVRGAMLISENAPGVGTVIAARVNPVVGELRAENGRGRICGVLEAAVLYLPGGSELAASARSELPFEIALPVPLDEDSIVGIQVLSAEASALMSDRLELKAQLAVCCETRRRETAELVRDVTEGAPLQRRPGIVIYWPQEGETAWQLGRRYAIPADQAGEAEAGKPLVVRS